jgi:hypothetical protein
VPSLGDTETPDRVIPDRWARPYDFGSRAGLALVPTSPFLALRRDCRRGAAPTRQNTRKEDAMRRIARAVSLVAVALGLVMTNVPAAEALSLADITFVGDAELTQCSGLNYPPPVGTGPDLATTSTTVITAPHPMVLLTGGKSCNFNADSDVCVGAEVSAKKLPPAGAGLCVLTANGSVNGYCGLSSGHGSGLITLGSQSFHFTFYFFATGGTLYVSGLITKHTTGQTGKIVAVVEALPPTPATTPEGGSCLTLATVFNLNGVGHAIMM